MVAGRCARSGVACRLRQASRTAAAHGGTVAGEMPGRVGARMALPPTPYYFYITVLYAGSAGQRQVLEKKSAVFGWRALRPPRLVFV